MLKRQYHFWKNREQSEIWDSEEGKKSEEDKVVKMWGRCAWPNYPKSQLFRQSWTYGILEALKFCAIFVFDK